jgi:DNA-binding beta-propeller fold protein YncE
MIAKASRLLLSFVVLLAGLDSAGAATPFRLQSETPLAGARPGWDYLAYDAAHGHLFINRRKDGVSVFDVKAKTVVAHIANSEGSNHTTLVPEIDRGYTTNADGSSTVFQLSTFKTLDRIKLGDDADASTYDPATGQVAFMMGGEKEVTLVDAATAKITGRIAMPAEELEASAPDGQGHLFIAERDRNRVAKVDLRSKTLIAEYPLGACQQPVGMAIDLLGHRVFVGCRGETPVLAVLDTVTGRLVASPPIGHGNDGVAYDPERRRIFTTNGKDSNLVIYDQTSADSYVLDQAVTTQAFARTLAYDAKSQTLYTVTAQGWVDPSKPVNEEAGPFYPNGYFDDTFVVLAYAPR